ncbi:MerR family transcriptional regulator [Clostridium peptidivorans]|uniref:MerR family transcriptional regulator n=1 Tax=Clostridium peptidivorans TaxID=100174 RepID=UPI000BE3C80F|nr:MerR family transcriptional regulator [Clostridium peptidivorans]
MNKNLQNYFSTGEFAKLCGVNKRTLFHYNDIGLLCPDFTDENGYRYYSHHQIDVFLIIFILKELKVPLKEIKTYLDERTPEQLLELSKQKISEINKEINKLGYMKYLLEETISFTNKGINAPCDEFMVEEQEEEYMIRSTLLNEENSKDHIMWMCEYKNFMNSIQPKDISFIGTMISKENIISGNYTHYSYFFTKTSNKNILPSIAVKLKGMYAVAYHHGSYETTYKTYNKLLEFLEKKHLRVNGFTYEEYLIDEVAARNENDYITQITVAVEEM